MKNAWKTALEKPASPLDHLSILLTTISNSFQTAESDVLWLISTLHARLFSTPSHLGPCGWCWFCFRINLYYKYFDQSPFGWQITYRSAFHPVSWYSLLKFSLRKTSGGRLVACTSNSHRVLLAQVCFQMCQRLCTHSGHGLPACHLDRFVLSYLVHVRQLFMFHCQHGSSAWNKDPN